MESNELAYIEDERFELKSELEKSIIENFRDPCCLGIVNIIDDNKKPAECLTCKQIFCYDCAHDLLNLKKDCPMCRNAFKIGNMNHKLLSILLDVECKCKNYAEGCDFVAPLKNLPSHHKECKFKSQNEGLKRAPSRPDPSLIKEQEAHPVINDLASQIEHLQVDDETMNDILAAGAFDKNGNIDFAKIQAILLSKKNNNSSQNSTVGNPEHRMHAEHQTHAQPQNAGGSRGNLEERKVDEGESIVAKVGQALLSNMFNAQRRQAGPRGIIINFIGDLVTGKYNQTAGGKKGSEGKGDPKIDPNNNMGHSWAPPRNLDESVQRQNHPSMNRNVPFGPPSSQMGAQGDQQNPQGAMMHSQSHRIDPSNVMPLDQRYRCPSNHNLALVRNLTQLPFSNNGYYNQNKFICRLCLQQQSVGPQGIIHCMTCNYDVCPQCSAFPLCCRNNHMLQKTFDLVKLPPNYKTNQVLCDICQVNVKVAEAGVLICMGCKYHMCMACAKAPVTCPQSHQLRRETDPAYFAGRKFKCSLCKQNRDLLDKGIGVLMCRNCLFYMCEDCFVNSRESMKFFCPKGHFLKRAFKFEGGSIFSLQTFNYYTCQQCKSTKTMDSKGVWNCKMCSYNICPDCLARA